MRTPVQLILLFQGSTYILLVLLSVVGGFTDSDYYNTNYVGGYKTENKEGFLQLPIIKNSKRFNDRQTTHIFLTPYKFAVKEKVLEYGNICIAFIVSATL